MHGQLGSSYSVVVTERVNVLRGYLTDLASLASRPNQNNEVARALEA